MGWGYRDWDKPKPRRAADGIKAKTQRGAFGKTWWAGQWIEALERLVDSGRLQRGRSYARSGQVLTLDIGAQGVHAKVQGSQVKPYKVSISFRTLSDGEWEKVIEEMSSEALYAARLLSGEMPEHIEEAFKAAGTSLFPATGADLTTDCSCPDWSNPCKHVAAVYYLLGERFDEDPFLIFELRGRSKEQISEALRARRTAADAGAGAAVGLGPPDVEKAAGLLPEEEVEEAEEVTALDGSLHTFWYTPLGLPDLALHFDAPPANALPVKRLGTPPFWRTSTATVGMPDFRELMEESYIATADYALRLAMGEMREEE